MKNKTEIIKSKIRNIPDFPKKGIIFRDITTLLQDGEGYQLLMEEFYNRYKDMKISKVAGVEARGFIMGGALADRLNVGFVTIRKPGKLPSKVISCDYELEYGTDSLEIHEDAVKKGERILIVDDLIATGGTSIAAAKLVEKLEGEVVELAFIVNLPEVGGEQKVNSLGYKMFSLCEFEGE